MCDGSALVRPETRERVKAPMQRLAYRPNALVRSLIRLSGNFDETARLRLPALMTVGYISVDYMARIEV